MHIRMYVYPSHEAWQVPFVTIDEWHKNQFENLLVAVQLALQCLIYKCILPRRAV